MLFGCSACSLFRDVDSVTPAAPTTMDMAGQDLPIRDAEPDTRAADASQDADQGDTGTECAAFGAPCDASTVCCSLGECSAQGMCAPRPCTVSDDCSGLQCVQSSESLVARVCMEPTCASCDGQNWCHNVVGCTNRTPCTDSAGCGAGEVCSANNLCLSTCQSNGECGGGECVELTGAELASVSDLGVRVCRQPVCNCRDSDDFCALDAACVLDDASCQVDADCGDARYVCDGVRCICDESVPDQCRFACSTNDDCGVDQVCDVALRRCQTEFCPLGGVCPAGYVCAPEEVENFAAMICRRAGASGLGDSCLRGSECASGMCQSGVCVQPCRMTSDCTNGQNCLFDGNYYCTSLEECLDVQCGAGEFCASGGKACQPFCLTNEDCPEPRTCGASPDSASTTA